MGKNSEPEALRGHHVRTPGLPSGSGLSWVYIQALTFTQPWPSSWPLWGFREHCRTTEAPGRFPHFKGGRVEAARPLSLGILWDRDMESSPWLCPDQRVNMAQGSLRSTLKVVEGECASPSWGTSSTGFRHRRPLGEEWQGSLAPGT